MFSFLLLNNIFFYFFVSVLESGQLFIPSLHKNGSLERYPLMSTIWTHCSINSVKTKSSGKSHHQKLHQFATWWNHWLSKLLYFLTFENWNQYECLGWLHDYLFWKNKLISRIFTRSGDSLKAYSYLPIPSLF